MSWLYYIMAYLEKKEEVSSQVAICTNDSILSLLYILIYQVDCFPVRAIFILLSFYFLRQVSLQPNEERRVDGLEPSLLLQLLCHWATDVRRCNTILNICLLIGRKTYRLDRWSFIYIYIYIYWQLTSCFIELTPQV